MKQVATIFSLFIFASFISNAQNVGIGNTNPLARLDVNGDMILRGADITLVNGDNDDVNTATSKFSFYNITGPTTPFNISGFTGGTDGRIISIYNSTPFLVTLKHTQLSAVANQLHTGSGIDFILSSYSTVTLRYMSSDNKWHISSSHNEWNPGSGSSQWDVNGSDIYNNNPGNVGINASSPSHAKLEINGRVGATVAMFGADAYGVGISANNPEIGFNYFYNNGTKTIKAGYGANLGMDPGNGNLYIGNFNGNQSTTDFGSITGYQNVLTITQSGNVGIKTPSPALALEVTGQERITGPVLSSPGTFGNLTSGGILFIKNNSDRKGLFLDATKMQSQESNLISSGSFANPFLINPYGGNVGIGTSDPGVSKLAVNGSIRSKEVVVESGWADYVFNDDYQPASLASVEKFIKENKHLPNIPSAQEIEKNGLKLAETQKLMMAKIEELTLYIIEQNKRIEQLEKNAGVKRQ